MNKPVQNIFVIKVQNCPFLNKNVSFFTTDNIFVSLNKAGEKKPQDICLHSFEMSILISIFNFLFPKLSQNVNIFISIFVETLLLKI